MPVGLLNLKKSVLMHDPAVRELLRKVRIYSADRCAHLSKTIGVRNYRPNRCAPIARGGTIFNDVVFVCGRASADEALDFGTGRLHDDGMFSARARHRDLAPLCRRLAMSLESGIDIRKILTREAQGRTAGSLRRRMEAISVRVASGVGVAEAVDAEGEYFPPLLRELIRVGERTGHLDAVFRRLAEHYEYQVKLRRDFLSSVSWPLTQLCLALGLIGLVIWVSGVVVGKDLQGRNIDLLGFGLRGTSGLIAYLASIACAGVALFVVVTAAKRGAFWARPIQRLALQVPAAGKALETLALGRFAWALHLTGEAGMNFLKSLPLSLQATQNDRYISQTEAIAAAVRRGETLTDALAATGAFPPRFLDVLDVGERSGRLPESMERLANQYEEEARSAIKVLMQVASWIVSLAVMAVIAFFIIRLALFYLGTINAASKMR